MKTSAVCTRPLKITATGDTKFDKDGNNDGCTYRRKNNA